MNLPHITRRLTQPGAWLWGLGLLFVASVAFADELKLESESYLIPSADPGIQLYIRNKHPAGVTRFSGEKILLFVHGATYPSETTFDLPLAGRSMMEHIAQQGWDVYLVDVRGYGGSTRPPEMDRPASENKPIVDTLVAVKDFGSAVNHILQRRSVAKINVMGWSWGTVIAGAYTTEHNENVNRLVLYAPQWIFSAPSTGPNPASAASGSAQVPAYRTVTKEAAKQRWLTGVAENKKADLIPSGWFEQWADATWATDPVGSKQTPQVLRAPNGIVQDLQTYWLAGKARYDPEGIRVPTLLIHAEWDAELPSYMTQTYFTKLTNAPYKRFVEIGQGTHSVMLEKNRMQFLREVMNFLNEPDALSLN
jgi:pimeloyl-ACP methyl ester carboxylesterase